MKVCKDTECLIHDYWIRSVDSSEDLNNVVDIDMYTESPDFFSYFRTDTVGIIIGFEI